MSVNYHQPSVNALFDTMSAAMLTFDASGTVTFANRAAKSHPGRPAESMAGKQVIRSLLKDIILRRVKLPYAANVELAGGLNVKGVFVPGPSGLDIAFLIKQDSAPVEESKRMELTDIMALMRDEIGPPLRDLQIQLRDIPKGPQCERLESTADALSQRLRRLADLIAVFGEDILITTDRVDLAEAVQTVCSQLAPKARSRKVHFEVEPPRQDLPPLYGNATLIRRALHECIDNAVNNSRREVNSLQDLTVHVSFRVTGEHVLIAVRNLGAMPDDFKGVETRDLFDKAAPGSSSEAMGRIGLPLVRRIIGLHGGNIRISAVGDDEVKVMIEFPTGAPQRGKNQLDIAQAQRYAADLAQLMSRRKKETI
jgi:signal transduction histidine kinase